MMAEAQADDDEVFVYTGGNQFVPRNVRCVRIDKSVKIIPRLAFQYRYNLIYVEFHDGIEEIGERAFNCCYSLRGVKLLGVKIIGEGAFCDCRGLTDIKFGSQLERIGRRAFDHCISLRNITMPSARSIGQHAFCSCVRLTVFDLPEGLETIGIKAFQNCHRLRRITIQLNCMIKDGVFWRCPKLTTVDLVGGIHNNIASLHLESWRDEMKDEINRINQVLPDTVAQEKTSVVRDWIRSVIRRLDYHKAQHKAMLKEATTLLELALWKAKIEEKEEDSLADVIAKKAKIDIQSKRSERRITSGANIVIKNVLPFLDLK